MRLDDIKLQCESVKPLGCTDHQECVKVDSFPILKQPYKHYNPMQSQFLLALEKCNWGGNIVVASPTASGKTTVAEIAMSIANMSNKKGIVLVPLRALAQEKYDDWTSLSHSFFDKQAVILTGDYSQQVTDDQLRKADIVIMTSEALDHRSRFMSKNSWLKDVGIVVVDEAHLLTLASRGDRLETCLMRFTRHNTDASIALLSATMPNVDDLKKWLEFITNRNTILIKSDYRPCKLEIEYSQYEEVGFRDGGWEANEFIRMELARNLVLKHNSDQWIVFTGGKKWGRDAVQFFKERRIASEFISADDDLNSRLSKVKGFKDGSIRVLISSSLLAYGLNLPARRVCVVHVRRGKQDIDTCDLIQMAGRAGRPSFDTKGTVHFLIPSSCFYEQKVRIEKGENIVSQLNNKKNLLFHVVAEVYNKEIIDAETFRDWYSRSLSATQRGHISLEEAQEALDALAKRNIIKKNDKGKYEITDLGKVSAWLYQSPLDVFRWWSNFNRLFEKKSIDDIDIALAVASIDTWEEEHVSKSESMACASFVSHLNGRDVVGGATKWATTIWNMLRGVTNNILRSSESNIGYDLERLVETIKTIDNMYGHWNKGTFFDTLHLRLKYRITEDKVELVKVKWIGGKIVEQLFEKGIKNIDDFRDPKNIAIVKSIMGKRLAESMESAKAINGLE